MRLHRPVMLKLERWQRSVFSKADVSVRVPPQGARALFRAQISTGPESNRRSEPKPKREVNHPWTAAVEVPADQTVHSIL